MSKAKTKTAPKANKAEAKSRARLILKRLGFRATEKDVAKLADR